MPKYKKRIIAVVFIILGLLALLTPFTPGSWLALVGLAMLGYKSDYLEKIKNKLDPKKSAVIFLLLIIFTSWFLHFTRSDFPLIFKKDLLAHDESSNSVVAANITRKFFPPMVRVNPLNEQQGIWMEGPFWQHIPPLFAYVPYIFFKLDGQVTIEVKRLSFAFVTLLTGLLFILGVYKFRKSLWAALAATLAAIFWISTPFTRELIYGYAFGVSDIVLAFTMVASFCAILWYLREEREERREYPYWKLILISLIVALPIMAKNLLGAIPAATFLIFLLIDHRSINKRVLVSTGSFAALILAYLLPLYFASPETFKNEILVSFLHFKKLEGWDRPWHYYLTNYLPQRYLFSWTWVYYLGFILAVISNFEFRISKQRDRRDKILLAVSGGWFLWNLAAISLVTSKVPNFIYQSYLLGLFFVVYSIVVLCHPRLDRGSRVLDSRFRGNDKVKSIVLILCLLIATIFAGRESILFYQQMRQQRAQAYNYSTEREKFYGAAEEMQKLGLNTKDLVIVRVSDNDCWARYNILFLTGAEARTLLEIYFHTVQYGSTIKDKYQRMFFLVNKSESTYPLASQRIDILNYSLIEYDLDKMSPDGIYFAINNFLFAHGVDIYQDIIRIKADKTSCQWLVPDAILNAPE